MIRTEPGPASPATRSILIVDDNPITAKAVAQLLGAQYPTVSFYRGASVIAYAREHGCLAAVVDVHLPDMNGLLVAERLRSLCGPDAPIIILSGDTSMETLNSLPHVGATYFFSKPVAGSTLLEKINESLGHASKCG
ncbi:MAG TPA: response regulator [Tepidisphaeraceae bacterium]|nr:response regulator [Tepidisphaeraceae bacterium]